MSEPTGEDAIAQETGDTLIDGPWGYACVKDGVVYIPAVVATEQWPLRRVLAELHGKARTRRFIFTAVLDAEGLKLHLRNIVREFDEYVPEFEDYSHCIEIEYEPARVSPQEGEPAS